MNKTVIKSQYIVKHRTGSFLKKLFEQKVLMLFMLPAVIFFFIFSYMPIYGIIMAFQSFSPALGFFKSPFVGFANFIDIFNMPDFLGALKNTLVISSLKILICFPAPIVFALLLNEIINMKFKRVVQTISYLPYFISWVIASGLWYKLLTLDGGPVNDLLLALGILKEPMHFMGESLLFYPILIFTDIWKNVGWNAIIYLAALAGINIELYEAARVDGAGRFKQMVHISLPGMKPAILLLFILTISGLLNADFDQLYTMGNAAVRDVGEILDTLILRTLQSGGLGDLSYGAAMGLFKTVIGFGLFILANQVSKKLSGESIF